MNKIKINQLEMLAAVADSGSFSKAAIALDCAQSRISHAIGELEQLLGTRLLTRARAGSVPTAAGQRVLLRGRQILALADDILAAPAATGKEIVGRVRLSCFRSIGTHVLPHALAALARAHPGIAIEIDDGCDNADDVADAILAGRADIGIGCAPYPGELLAQHLLSDDYILLLPAVQALRAPLSWSQLDGLALIEPVNRRTAALIARYRADGLKAKARHRLVSDSGIMAMVALGQGFSVIPRLAAMPLTDGVMAAAPPLAARRDFALLALPATARQPAVRAVMRGLRERRMLRQVPAFRAGIFSLD